MGIDESANEAHSALAELLTDPEDESASDTLIRKDMHRDLDAALGALDAREREVIERYYGLGRHTGSSLETIGSRLRLSRERVRQIRNRAFAQIHECSGGARLEEYLG